MSALYGPVPISANLQIRLPVKVARALHVQAGDEFFVRVSDEDPGSIVLLPVEVVERRYGKGEELEKAELPSGGPLDRPSPAAES